MKDIKPLFSWALAYGESKVIDRILVKLLPELLSCNLKITPELINTSSEVLVPESLFIMTKSVAEDIVGQPYTDSI
jgi:hypothetical protein